MNTKVSALVLVLVVASSVVLCQGRNPNITGAGARAAGMGNAFIGVADDATAIVWNPAGLAQLERMEVSAVGRYVWESSEATDNKSKESASSSQDHPMFNFGSFAIPFSLGESKLVIAAAYQRQLDFYGKESGPNSSSEEKGGADAASPGVALGFGSIFSVGAAANIWFGKDEYTATSTSSIGGTVPLEEKDVYDATISGLNFLAGVLVDLHGLKKPVPIKFGAAVRTPFDLKFDYTRTVTVGTRTSTKREGTQTNEIPIMIGFGLSGNPTENLTLSADYEIRKFKDTKVIDQSNVSGSVADTSDLTFGNNDLNQFRVGAEYLIVARAGVIPIRIGYKSVPTGLVDVEFTNTSPFLQKGNQVIGSSFTVGTGFIGGTFAFDFAYSYSMYETKWTGTVDYSGKYTEHMLSGSVIVYF